MIAWGVLAALVAQTVGPLAPSTAAAPKKASDPNTVFIGRYAESYYKSCRSSADRMKCLGSEIHNLDLDTRFSLIAFQEQLIKARTFTEKNPDAPEYVKKYKSDPDFDSKYASDMQFKSLYDNAVAASKDLEAASALLKKYEGFDPAKVKDGTWTTFWTDFGAFNKKNGIKSISDLAKYPELMDIWDKNLKSDGARVAFRAAGFDLEMEQKNYCFEKGENGILEPAAQMQVVSRLLAKYEPWMLDPTQPGTFEQKEYDCHATCSEFESGEFGCYPSEGQDFEIKYGKKDLSQTAEACYDGARGCANGLMSDDSDTRSTVLPMSHLPITQVYQAVEPDFTERASDFMMNTLMNSYIRLADVNARDDRHRDELLGVLEGQLKSCGKEQDEKADQIEKSLFSGAMKQEIGGARRAALTKRKQGEAIQARFAQSKSRSATVDAAAETDKTKIRGDYQGKMAQAAECTQRVADRLIKLQALLYDNAKDRGRGSHSMPSSAVARGALKVADFALSVATPSLFQSVWSQMENLPSIDRIGTVDDGVTRDRLGPICGKWSEHFNSRIWTEKDRVELSLDGAKFEVTRANLGHTCSALRKEEAFLTSQLDSIYNQYPALFRAQDHSTKTSVSNDIVSKLADGDRNATVRSYRRGVPLSPKPFYFCQTYEGDMKRGAITRGGQAFGGDNQPIVSQNCGAERGPVGNGLLAGAIDYSRDPAFAGMEGNYEQGQPSCIDVATRKEPSPAHRKAAEEVLGKSAKETMEKLGKQIKDMACGDKSPGYYRDAVIDNADLYKDYLACEDGPSEATCQERKTDAWMACVRNELLGEERRKKAIDEAIENSRKQLISDMIEGLSAMDVLGVAGVVKAPLGLARAGVKDLAAIGRAEVKAALKTEAKATFKGTAKEIAQKSVDTTKALVPAVGMGVGFGAGMVGVIDLAGLMPTDAEIKAVADKAQWDEAGVAAGFVKASEASQSMQAKLQMDAQVNPYTHAIAMAVIMGAFGVMTPNGAKAGSKATAKWARLGKGFAGTEKEMLALSKDLGALVELDPDSAILALRNWKTAMKKLYGADKAVAAEASLLKSLQDVAFKRFGVALDGSEKLGVERLYRILADPKFEGMTFPERLAALKRAEDAEAKVPGGAKAAGGDIAVMGPDSGSKPKAAEPPNMDAPPPKPRDGGYDYRSGSHDMGPAPTRKEVIQRLNENYGSSFSRPIEALESKQIEALDDLASETKSIRAEADGIRAKDPARAQQLDKIADDADAAAKKALECK